MPITINTSNIKTNVHLSQIAIQYKNADFAWNILAPQLGVNRESDKYRKYKKDGYFSGAPIASDGAPTEEASLSYDEETYTTHERKIKDLVTDRSIANSDNEFNLKADTTRFVSEKVKLGVEIDVADKMISTSGGISSSSPDHVVTPTNLWDDQTNSDPEADIAIGKEAVMKATGRKPNVLLVSGAVERHLATHPNIKELRKYTSTDALTKGGIPSTLWDLEVTVASSIYNTAKKGRSVSMDFVWGKNVIIAYVNPADSITLARTFILNRRWMIIDTWRDDEREGDWIRAKANYVPRVVCSDCGYLLSEVIS
jgi:hypothetical protein